jgi:putative ABC transport system permease protein
MRAIWHTTVQGVAARKVRLALTALSIVLGVAFVAGVYVLTDTLRRSFDIAFAQTGVGIDLVVRHVGAFEGDGQGRDRPQLPAAAVDEVRSTPGVAGADGFVQGFAQFVDANGEIVSSAGAPTVGISWSTTPGVGPLRIADGRAPTRDGEVAMDDATARRLGYRVGDDVGVLLLGPLRQFRLVGLFTFGERTDLGPLTFAAFDLQTAQKEFGDDGLDAINVVLDDGAELRTVERAIGAQLGDVEVLRATDVVAETAEPVEETLGFLNAALLGFAGIGLLVGGFIIFNTFTILVSQRTRELGLLRAVGGSRAQIIGSVLAEAFIVGVAGSLVGLGLGIGLARVLLDVLPSFGLTVPDASLVIATRTIVASFVIGVGVTTAAALHPAFRAARVSPVAALGESHRDVGAAPLVRRTIAGVVIAAAGLAVSWYGINGELGEENSVAVAFLGVFIVFLGLVAVGPVLARPLARTLGRPLPTFLGVTGSLARGNAARNPRRTSSTAAALVIGLGLVCLVAIFTESAKASLRTGIDDGLRADTVTSGSGSSMSSELATRMRRLPESGDVVTIRFGEVRFDGSEEHLAGVTPAGVNQVLQLDVTKGAFDGSLAEDEILVSDREARHYDLTVGDRVSVTFPQGGARQLRVAAVYENQNFLGDWSVRFMINQRLFDQGFQPPHRDWYVLANARDRSSAGVSGLVAAADRELAAPFPNATVRTRAGYVDAQENELDTFLNVFVALLLLSEVIALLGIVNTLFLSVYERTREIGLLRAVGMSRRQVRRMVRGESVVITLIGCALGVLIGLLWAWAVVSALSGHGITSVVVPPRDLLLFVVVSAIAGFLAALLPAWRASRLDVLEAISHD